MRRGRRRSFTAAQRAEMWSRYKAGESILAIGRALDRAFTTVHREFQYTGGIAPEAPEVLTSRRWSSGNRASLSSSRSPKREAMSLWRR
jgi:transposase-like protein